MSTLGRPLHFTRMFILAAVAIAASWVHPGHADAPPGRYMTKNGTVIDTKTLLTWEQGHSIMPQTFGDAQTRCAMLVLDGMGWRVPSMKELQTIVDRAGVSPKIDPTAFPNTPKDAFWTSTSWAASPSSEGWVVKFTDGYTTFRSKSLQAQVRCVR